MKIIKSIFRNYTLSRSLTTLLLLLSLYLFIINFVSRENYVLSWGFADRYAEFIQVNRSLKSSGIFSTVKLVFNSIQQSDYNFLTAFILSPSGLIFGTSRLVYILTVITFLFLPAFLLYLQTVDAFNPRYTFFQFLNLNLVFLLSPIILIPIIRNQPSVIGLIPIILILSTYRRRHFLVLSLLISLLPLLNRWYLFFSLNFIVYYSLFSVYHRRFSNLLIIPLSATLFLLFSGPLWQKFFLVNYHQAYSFFRFSGDIFKAIFSTFSQLNFILVLSFFLFFLSKRKYFLICIFVSLILEFLYIQDFNLQHYYLLIVPILFASAGIIKENRSRLVQVIFLLFIVANFQVKPIIDPIGTTTFIQIVSDLQQLPSSAKIYVVSNSRPINASAFENYTCYFHPSSLCPQILPVSYIMTRDGFPASFSEASYFLLLDPETNSDPAITDVRSLVIQQPSTFKPIKEYPLYPSQTVKLYQKI